MDNNTHKKINVEPLYTFFTEETTPKAFAKLLDEFLIEHFAMLVRLQKLDKTDKSIHENTNDFIHYFKVLKDILPYCEIKKEDTI